MIKQLLTMGAAMTLAGSVQATELPQQAYLNLDTAQKLANAALTQCATDGYNVSVSVVDASGITRVQIRADNAGP
ncbi:MAG: heme-binding protein, partial [Amphritea sp.]|nr:heme-binding protein [Amphritea sp.]